MSAVAAIGVLIGTSSARLSTIASSGINNALIELEKLMPFKMMPPYPIVAFKYK